MMVTDLSRNKKIAILMGIDAITTAFMLFLSYWFIEFIDQTGRAREMWWLLPVASIVTVSTFYFTGLYKEVLRFVGLRFFVGVVFSCVVVSAVVAAIALLPFYGQTVGFSRLIFPELAVLLSLGTMGTRVFAKWCLEVKSKQHSTPAVIYGAGKVGRELFSALRYGNEYAVVAFIDDDGENQRVSIRGTKVFPVDQLDSLIQKKAVQTVLLAMPNIDATERAGIIESLKKYDVEIKKTPNIADYYSGKANLTDIQDLSIEDLMSRPTVEVNEELAGHCVTDKSVLITGAGGSIGSELCRQIVKRNPNTVVLYEMSESALFYIEQELLNKIKNTENPVHIVSVLGNVLDKNRLQETLLANKVNTVFHAAAYKHVPMLESNPVEGIRNNVIGTKRTAEASAWANVESLVVISTDKAVRPTNLMGATKRFAELVVQSIAKENSRMRTCMVRFGNVLGSSGSVVPTFHKQIKEGGPVRVTHKDVTRYFMTIPEASQLVMQAGALARETEVFVLDMGEPKRIYDLAKEMIEKYGLTEKTSDNPNGDIEILFDGLRPGEKMYEELSIDDCLESTAHQKISQSIEKQQDLKSISDAANKLEKALQSRDTDEVMSLVCRAVPEYEPSEDFYSQYPSMMIATKEKTTKEEVL
jgi:FlaA1/EpsC-like NDP-sugar epimerase